jgi:hypothetical protein
MDEPQIVQQKRRLMLYLNRLQRKGFELKFHKFKVYSCSPRNLLAGLLVLVVLYFIVLSSIENSVEQEQDNNLNDSEKLSHYFVIVDAGSSGSRVQIYEWKKPTTQISGEFQAFLPVIEEPVKSSLKISPGVSSYNYNEVFNILRQTLFLGRFKGPCQKINSSRRRPHSRRFTAFHAHFIVCNCWYETFV